MSNLIYILIILIIIIMVMMFVLNRKNKYIFELEEVISEQIKLESKRINELEAKLSKELVDVNTKKKELTAAKRKMNKGRSKVKIIKTNFTNEKKSTNIISDFANLDSKISLFEDSLDKLKKGYKK